MTEAKQKPILYLLVGYPGSGKTTVSKLIHKITGAKHLWADHERNKRFNQPKFTHNENIELYDQLNHETAKILKSGQSVIFDTNFNYKKDRDRLRKIAGENKADCKVVWIQTPEAIAKTRAVEDSDADDKRLWGNMDHETFDRLSTQLEAPVDENPIIIHGIDVNEERVRTALRIF